jgi:hypothetical protein
VDSDSQCRRHSGTIWLTDKVLSLTSFSHDQSVGSTKGYWLQSELCSAAIGPYVFVFFMTCKLLILKLPLMEGINGTGMREISGRSHNSLHH